MYSIDEKFLQKIETLDLILKNSNFGSYGGNHKSKLFGSSSEFADYRDYLAGDEMTKIDWNAYQRFNKLYLKLYLDERQSHTKIYIDASRSMVYGKGDKADYALKLAAIFAYISICNMDKASIYYIKDNKIYDVAVNLANKDSFYSEILKLNQIEFSGDCFISESLLPLNVGYGDGLSIIISDFLTDNNYEAGIDHLVDKKRDVLCIQVLSKEEIKPKIRGKVQLYDSEDNNKIFKKNVNKDVIIAYEKALNYIKERLQNYCNSRDASYLFVQSNADEGEVFLNILTQMGVLK